MAITIEGTGAGDRIMRESVTRLGAVRTEPAAGWGRRARDAARAAALLLAGAGLFAGAALATPGEDGDITLNATTSTSDAILNSYTTLSAAASAGSSTFTVSSVSALALPACPPSSSCTGAVAPDPPITGATAGMGSALGPGDLLMIYQPQDTDAPASAINTSDTASFGAVNSYEQAGLYEFVYVRSVSGSTITIVTSTAGVGGQSACSGLTNGYDAGAMVIRVPQLRNLTVNNNRRITAPAWNGSTGGVVAVAVERRAGSPDTGGVLSFPGATNNGRFDVSGLGFRGGALDDISAGSGPSHITAFFSAACADGGHKGESIFGWSGTWNGATTCGVGATGLHVGRALSRGALANGGGGGNAHNAGGGGGANGGAIANWTGAGVPNASFAAIWAREAATQLNLTSAGDDPSTPGVQATTGPLAVVPPALGSTTLANSTGGGRGGYSFGANGSAASPARNPLTEGPQVPPRDGTNQCGTGDAARQWSGNCRANVGGVGGRPLDRGTNGVQRLFFGGGGGAGDANSNAGGAGGNGGGLIFAMAYEITDGSPSASNPRFVAQGAAGQNTSGSHNDAPGGGGGGGTIVLTTSLAIPTDMRFDAAGGGGGNQLITSGESEGPGGGGGGGVVAIRSLGGTPSVTVAGGSNGTTTSSALNTAGANPFPPNGATAGGAGESILGPSRNGPMFQCVNAGCTTADCFPTPVTSAWFESERHGRTLQVRFATSAEVGNAGFWIEGASTATASRRERVSQFIPAQAADPSSARFYEVAFPDPGATHLWLVDLDAQGRSTRRGPYAVGERYGSRPETRSYDWTQALLDVSRGRGASAGDVAYLTVTTAGMHRVTHEALVAAGVNLAGVPAREIALVSRAGAVARAVRGPSVFGPGSVVEFHGDPSPDLWSRSERYVLKRASDPNEVREIPVVAADWGGARGTSLAEARAEHVPPRWYYEPASPSDSPWYQYQLTATAPGVGQDLPVVVSHPAGSDGTLTVRLYGGIDLDGAAPDHHVRIRLNGVEVASRRFDGITAQRFEIPVTNVVAGTNVVRVELPFDTGYDVDQVVVEGVALTYRTAAEVRDGRFEARGVTTVATLEERIFADGIGEPIPTCIPYQSTEINVPNCIPVNFERTQVAIAGRTADQSIWVVGAGSVMELQAAPTSGLSGDLAHSPGSTLVVANRATLPMPEIAAAPALESLPTGSAEYVVITHAAFRDALAPLVARRQSQGLSTAVIDVEQLYRRYTAGNAHPEAIRAFMREHARALGTRYLVLAGGANYNSVGLLPPGTATLSHIPTPYVAVNPLVNFAPADALYGDLTGDSVAEVAVGRLPVRTVAEASEAVRKILAYEAQPATGRFLLASGGQDLELGLDFRAATTGFAATLPPAWAQTRVDVDTLGAAAARLALIDGLNFGQSVISYTGHSGPIQWGFEPLLTASQVSGLPANANQPFLLQFGCWTTYFASPVTLTMGNAWMLTPNAGASGVLGATVLLDQPNHDALAAALGPRLQSGQRLGDAVEAARRALAPALPLHGGSEVLAGVTLLGDPAMPLR
jgi:hypothetical protein